MYMHRTLIVFEYLSKVNFKLLLSSILLQDVRLDNSLQGSTGTSPHINPFKDSQHIINSSSKNST